MWYPTTMGFPTKNDHFGWRLGVPPFKDSAHRRFKKAAWPSIIHFEERIHLVGFKKWCEVWTCHGKMKDTSVTKKLREWLKKVVWLGGLDS